MSYMLHEVLEVHEIAAFKTVTLTKAKTMKGLVTDQRLKDILQAEVDVSTRHLQELSDILTIASH